MKITFKIKSILQYRLRRERKKFVCGVYTPYGPPRIRVYTLFDSNDPERLRSVIFCETEQ